MPVTEFHFVGGWGACKIKSSIWTEFECLQEIQEMSNKQLDKDLGSRKASGHTHETGTQSQYLKLGEWVNSPGKGPEASPEDSPQLTFIEP